MHLTNKEILDKPFELLLPYLDISFSSPTTVDKEPLLFRKSRKEIYDSLPDLCKNIFAILKCLVSIKV